MKQGINTGKIGKLLDITPEAVSKLTEKANEQGQTFKYYAQTIIENAAKKLK